MQLEKFYQYSLFKKRFLTQERNPFYQIASKYFTAEDICCLDIGSGTADFFQYLEKLEIPTKNIFLLDANERTVQENKGFTINSILYMAPDVLPFADHSVDVIHLSHLVDNLGTNDLYFFLNEINRVLKNDGHLIISTPLLWPLFYNDLSHTRPYNPLVFYKYFIQPNKSSRFDKIPGNYKLIELVYRYFELPLDEGWSSTTPLLDLLFISLRRILRKIGIKRLQKNGYTLVIKKLK